MIEFIFSDEEFWTAKEKAKTFKAWQRFIRNGFTENTFSKSLYEHLHLHCGFIAHYNKRGFYETYFDTLPNFKQFWRQFGGDGRMADLNFGVPFREYAGWGAATALDLSYAMIDYAKQVNGTVMRVVEMYERGEAEKYHSAVDREALRKLALPGVAALVDRALTIPFSGQLQAMIAASFGAKVDSKARKAAKAKVQARQQNAQMALF